MRRYESMRKVTSILFSFFLLIALAECGEAQTEEKEIDSVESNDSAD